MPVKRKRLEDDTTSIIKGEGPQLQLFLIDVPDRSKYTITIKVLKVSSYPVVGILPGNSQLDNDIGWGTLRDQRNGYFIDLTDGALWKLGLKIGDCTAVKCAQGGLLRLAFASEPEPLVSYVDEKGCHGLPFPTHRLDKYNVYLVLADGAAVELAVDKHRTKRRRTPTSHLLEQMWNEREFTDAEIVCNANVWQVHRAVLCKASPVFKATFGGQMQEATTARMVIKEASDATVEAMLRYIYTGRLEPSLAHEVIALAHRFQLDDLVAQCCEHALASLTAANVVAVARALRKLRDQGPVKDAWEKLIETVSGDAGLARGILETM